MSGQDNATLTGAADPSMLAGMCGPVEGYTQFTITGKNLREIGRNAAKCIFNNTLHTNATLLDKNRMVCDSPPLESSNGDMWYNISVTLDGGSSVFPTPYKFRYYKQPKFLSVSPNLGPMDGGTNVIVRG
jgi:hypothetical protein